MARKKNDLLPSQPHHPRPNSTRLVLLEAIGITSNQRASDAHHHPKSHALSSCNDGYPSKDQPRVAGSPPPSNHTSFEPLGNIPVRGRDRGLLVSPVFVSRLRLAPGDPGDREISRGFPGDKPGDNLDPPGSGFYTLEESTARHAIA